MTGNRATRPKRSPTLTRHRRWPHMRSRWPMPTCNPPSAHTPVVGATTPARSSVASSSATCLAEAPEAGWVDGSPRRSAVRRTRREVHPTAGSWAAAGGSKPRAAHGDTRTLARVAVDLGFFLGFVDPVRPSWSRRRCRFAPCCCRQPAPSARGRWPARRSPGSYGPPRQPTRRKRLDHPQKHPRPHRMATTTPPRPRPTPHQHLPPPRTIPPQPRRRRQTRLTPEREPHGAHAPPGPPCSHKPQRPGALTTTHQPFCKAAGVCPRRCGPSPLEQSVGIARLLMAWTARSRAKRCRHDSTASAHRCPRRESMNTWASAAPVAHGLPRWPARLVICVGSPSPARLSRLLGASGSAGRRGGNIHR